jgi:hypothetical protein
MLQQTCNYFAGAVAVDLEADQSCSEPAGSIPPPTDEGPPAAAPRVPAGDPDAGSRSPRAPAHGLFGLSQMAVRSGWANQGVNCQFLVLADQKAGDLS